MSVMYNLLTSSDNQYTDLEYSALQVVQWVLLVLMFVAALVAIILVLFQQSNSDGIQGITGSSETFFGKNKGKSIESKLKKWSWICLGVLGVLSIAFFIIQILI